MKITSCSSKPDVLLSGQHHLRAKMQAASCSLYFSLARPALLPWTGLSCSCLAFT